jgi:hypothetical protein
MGTTRVGRRTTADFIALAEEISGQQLDELFQTWLFTDTKPVLQQASLQAQAAAGGGLEDVLREPPLVVGGPSAVRLISHLRSAVHDVSRGPEAAS